MRFDNRHIFSGKINGKSLSDLRQLDYKAADLESRKQIVEDLINSTRDEKGLTFFENYVDRHYKDKLNGSDELSEGHDVFKTLENFANYLLGSDEIRAQRKNDEQRYKFYIDEAEFRLRTQKEQLFENVANDNEMSSDNVIHFLLTSQNENYKLASNLTVTAKDIHGDDYCGEVLREYHKFLTHIDKQIKNPDDKYKGKRYILTKNKNSVLNDMLLTKTQLKGIIKAKHVCKDSTVIEWDCFDWSNHSHIKELLYVQSGFHPENEVSFYLLDLETLVKEMISKNKLTKSEKQVFSLVRKGYKNNEIADMLQVRRTYISNTVAIIVKKISNYAVSKGWHKDI